MRRWIVLCALCVGWGCQDEVCVPGCELGYQCVYGQCRLEPEGGREQAIRCERYCLRLQECQRTTFEACKASQCATPIAQLPAVEKQFRLRFYECHLALSCQDIANYLELQQGPMRECSGCLQDLHCPGGFRCDQTKRICLNVCQSEAQCRASYTCRNSRCEAQISP